MNVPTFSINLPQARVLVVDDQPGTATTLARTISQLGPEVEVVSATSGKRALEQVRESAVDLVIRHDDARYDWIGIDRKIAIPSRGPTGLHHSDTAYDVPRLKESARRLKMKPNLAILIHAPA